MVKTIGPGMVVPIHTEHPGHFAKHVANVFLPQDGVPFGV